MKPTYYATALACLTIAGSLQAADLKTETMIVTGTRTPIALSESLSAVTVLQRADIERYQAVDLYELLSRVPSVSFIRNGGRGSATSLLLRGNQSDHSLFLVDGVRIGSATLGSASLSAISTSLIERVEIIRGPKSNLYGADAIGGVVNIITRKTSAPKMLSIETSFGSNQTTETTVVGGVSGDSYQLTAVINAFNTDGIDHTEAKSGVNGDDDASRNNSVSLNYKQQLSSALSLSLSYNRNDSNNEYDTGCGDVSTFAPVDCYIYSENFVDAFSGLVEFKASEFWTTSLQLGTTRDETANLADNIDIATTYNGGEFNTTKTEATWLNNVNVGAMGVVTAGLDYQLDEVDSDTAYDEDSRYNQAVFAQWQLPLGALDTNIGARYDDNEQFGDYSTYSALFGLTVSDQLRVTASYGEGFKAPTFNDLYFPFFGNPNFEPEESSNYELGLKGDFAIADFSLAVFKNELENLIQYNPAIFGSDQTAKAEITGLEFAVDTELAGWLLGFSGSIIDPENSTNGKLLRRRAERSMAFDADYAFSQFSIGFSARAESERFDDVANTAKLGGYTTFAIRAAYRINDEWQLKAKVDNLGDKQYATARDFSLGEYQAIGREAFISVVYTPSL